MSPPTKQLGKLSIGENMPTTRSEVRRAQDVEAARRDEEDDDDFSDDPPGDESDESEEEEEEEEDDDCQLASMVRARSEIVYDLESLEMESRARALAGLTGQFDVVYCREAPGIYEFQLAERPRVRIRAGVPQCTCSEFENRPDIACRHIFVSFFSALSLCGDADGFFWDSGLWISCTTASPPERLLLGCPYPVMDSLQNFRLSMSFSAIDWKL